MIITLISCFKWENSKIRTASMKSKYLEADPADIIECKNNLILLLII